VERERQRQPAWEWPAAERVAGLYMHLGRPADARRVWQAAERCPSEALRLCRLASTFWVERNWKAAVSHFQQARQADPQLAEACWGLAMLQGQLGDAPAALEACRTGLRLPLNERQRSDLKALEKLLLTSTAQR
jgi:tetratricopeptide (TPR) repeat protein